MLVWDKDFILISNFEVRTQNNEAILIFGFGADFFVFYPGSSSNIAKYQFKILSTHGQSVYYYYPSSVSSPLRLANANGFDKFHEDFKEITNTFNSLPTNDDPSNHAERFRWLEKYRREDQIDIDRNIADGTITLKRRESKFREELERHEFEYIVYKDFT